MPNPRDRIKGTGDTHPPEVEDDFDTRPDDDATARLSRNRAAALDAAGAGGRTGSARSEPTAPSGDLVEQAREHVRAHPLLAVTAAFVLGFLIGPRR